MSFVKATLFAAALTTFAFVANAATVLSTGTFAGSTTFISSAGGPIVGYTHPAYAANDASSEWVWDADLAASPVTFSVNFSLHGFDAATASLSGLWGVDNFASAYLNGTKISSLLFGYDAFTQLHAYNDAGAAFNKGLNTLTFVVENTGSYDAGNPAAFRATVNVTAATVPVPAALPLLAGAMSLLGFGALRRRRNPRV